MQRACPFPCLVLGSNSLLVHRLVERFYHDPRCALEVRDEGIHQSRSRRKAEKLLCLWFLSSQAALIAWEDIYRVRTRQQSSFSICLRARIANDASVGATRKLRTSSNLASEGC